MEVAHTERKEKMSRVDPKLRLAGEKDLDQDVLRDLREMYNKMPVIQIARKSFMSMILAEPFTVSIPALGLKNSPEMEKIFTMFYIPWLYRVYDESLIVGVVPYYFEYPSGEGRKGHPIPVTPDPDLGEISVYVDDNHKKHYRWYWNHGTQVGYDPNMLWVITDKAPQKDGTIISPMASLLPTYSALMKILQAQNVAVAMAARPVHRLEFKPDGTSNKQDALRDFSATMGIGSKAAGVTEQRRAEHHQQKERRRVAETYSDLTIRQAQLTMENTMQPVLYSQSAESFTDESDSGFPNRTVILPRNYTYGETARPTLLADYQKAETGFNMLCAAVMGFSLELLQPTGSSRVQNIKGSERFENDRIRDQTTFFIGVLQAAFVMAYEKQLREAMDRVRKWSVEKFGGDPRYIFSLHPELDVVVDMSVTSIATMQDFQELHQYGWMSKEQAGKHVFKAYNLPLEQLEVTEWPDLWPREMLVKPQKQERSGSSGADKPPKKRPKN